MTVGQLKALLANIPDNRKLRIEDEFLGCYRGVVTTRPAVSETLATFQIDDPASRKSITELIARLEERLCLMKAQARYT